MLVNGKIPVCDACFYNTTIPEAYLVSVTSQQCDYYWGLYKKQYFNYLKRKHIKFVW